LGAASVAATGAAAGFLAVFLSTGIVFTLTFEFEAGISNAYWYTTIYPNLFKSQTLYSKTF
jgi:hypothetical protein